MRKWDSKELELVKCDFCGADEFCAEYTRGDGMRVVECAICGLAYLNPRPLNNLIATLYKEEYFTGVMAKRGEGGLNLELGQAGKDPILEGEKRMPRPIELINDRFGGLHGKDVLEIGCATGDLLERMVQEGARASGLEISDFAARLARSRGMEVTTGTIENYLASNARMFDIVMAFEVIEHVTSPMRFFESVVKCIKPGGLLLLSTPNYSCASRYGGAWFGFNCSFEHLYFFNAETLKRLAGKAGCTLQYWETTTWNGGPAQARTNFLYMNISRLSRLLSFVTEEDMTFMGALRAWLSRRSQYRAFGPGHRVTAVFRKDGSKKRSHIELARV